MSKSIIIKTHHHVVFTMGKIQRVLCIVDAENIAKIIDSASLTANPRESKKNKVTTAIIDTLSVSPVEMVNRTKGLLISLQKCEVLERGRFRLTFEDDKTDGLLDGGHNILAVGVFLLENFFKDIGDEIPSEVRKIRNWSDFVDIWDKYRKDLVYGDVFNLFISKQRFEMPVEIIFPNLNYDQDYDYAELVFEISDARNNNAALTSGTKADHRGYYSALKKNIDPEIRGKIAWKDNESGKSIRREHIVSLALIPFIALQEKGGLEKVKKINPVTIYSSTSQCIELFSSIIENYANEEGTLPVLIENCLSLMHDIPKIYDLIYQNFPEAYNAYSPRFGGIGAVSTKQNKSRFYKMDCEYNYPEGYIYPLICSLHKLIDIDLDTQNVQWKINLSDIVKKGELHKYCKMLVSTIKDNHYNPQNVGKSRAAYEGCEITFEMAAIKSNALGQQKL